MKNTSRLITLLLALVVFASCEHTVSTETTVHPDGNLDKVMTFENRESSKNVFGVGENNGWSSVLKQKVGKSGGKDQKWKNIWQKSFFSAEEVNAQFASPTDTLLRMTTSFDRKFRWFYTYLYYSETYHAINNFDLSISDYVTKEDYSFIDRLPAEGKKISKADSLYLSQLNKKLFDIYGLKAIYEEYYSLHVKLMNDEKLEAKWIDTLGRHKEDIFHKVENDKDLPDEFFLNEMDSLHIPLPYTELKSKYKSFIKPVSRKMDFISMAGDGKYLNKISMPWSVIKTNADSVINNQLFWKPPVIKFLIKDYTMYAEARQLNYWAVGVSVLVFGLTGFVLMRKRNR